MAEEELQRKPWKVWMSSAPQPTAVLTTAYDLLKDGGTKLGHNLVILNENVYAATVFNGNFEQFYRYALDLSPATFDKRAKTRVESVDLTSLGITGTWAQDPIDFYVQDKDAALYPHDLKTSFAVNNTWKQYFRNVSMLSQKDVTTSYRVDEMFTAQAESDSEKSSSDIFVKDTDEVFTATMVFEDGKKAYTTVGVNHTDKILQLVLGALLFNSNKSTNLTDLKKFLAGVNTAERTEMFSKLVSAQINGVPLLRYIYIWVKAPFCADYIDPADFNQDLNQDASVTHKNLLLANDYSGVRNNFNRYDELGQYSDQLTPEDSREKMSRPYCPMTTPMKDLLSEKLMLLSGITGETVKEKAQKLIEDSLKDESYIGSVLVAPKGSSVTDNARYTPFTYYDPESRDDEEDYAAHNKLPTLIGRDGNLTTDGRIMSPTIDELWYIIYKAILGNSNKATTFLSSPAGTNYGPTNKELDTSLFEATKEYKWDNYKGTPLSFLFSTDSNGAVNGIDVDEWVANPDEHLLTVHTQIKNVSKKLNKFFDEQNPEEADTRGIFQTGGDIALGDEATHSAEFGYADREYGPRSSAPLSLRELEAALMGIKYNLDNNFIFESKTYTVSGKFGKVEKDDGVIIAGGSLYQMHRDYNADVENPNTVFKMGADNTGNNGRDATFGDLNNQEELHKTGVKVYLLDKNNKRTATLKTSGMPLLVENYGKSVSLAAEQGEYTGSDVYMAADGTWRYKAEHIRTPILRSRY